LNYGGWVVRKIIPDARC